MRQRRSALSADFQRAFVTESGLLLPQFQAGDRSVSRRGLPDRSLEFMMGFSPDDSQGRQIVTPKLWVRQTTQHGVVLATVSPLQTITRTPDMQRLWNANAILPAEPGVLLSVQGGSNPRRYEIPDRQHKDGHSNVVVMLQPPGKPVAEHIVHEARANRARRVATDIIRLAYLVAHYPHPQKASH